ncbi:MAG: hypothetical protein Q8R92_12660 [Deltaproteobacteria bacterium]|nr:hypothetical protein [Deltaproteobacteria bacterium]
MPKTSHLAIALAALLAFAGMAGVAQAQVGLGGLATGQCVDQEPNGFPGVIDAPAFIVTKTYDVFGPNDPNNPAPLAGNNTYVYTLIYTGSSCTPLGAAPAVIRFEIIMDTTFATGAGYIASSSGVAPVATTIGAAAVSWDFRDPLNPGVSPGLRFTCPAGPGEVSKQIYIQAALLPGLVSENAVSVDGQLSLDAPGTCVGPFVEPQMEDGDAMPCTIGWWKNRYDEKKGTTQYFPDPDFDQVVTAAVALCQPVFTDEADLLTQLSSKGKRSILIRGEQQLAAWCLNMAAGDLFPNNLKCKLFDGNWIIHNACGDNLTVGDALTQAISDITSGNEDLQHDAHDCADDVNNGISVINSMP